MSADSESHASFIAITGSTPEQAAFYLDSASNNLELAVSAFFDSAGGGAAGAGDEDDLMGENDDEDDGEEQAIAPVPAAAAVQSGGGRTLGGGPAAAAARAPAATYTSGGGTLGGGAASPMPAGWGTGSGASSSSSSRSSTPINPMRNNAPQRVSTLRDLSAPAPAGPSRGGFGTGGPSSDDEEDAEQAEFFTGGEKSGLSVENPNAKRKGNPAGGASDSVKGILQKAKDAGTRMAGALAGPSAPAQSRSVFSGSAHTLGSDETPSTLIPDPTSAPSRRPIPGSFFGGAEAEEEEEEDDSEPAVRNLTFWKDGFSIEDGDLLGYEEHKEILSAIESGRAPLSLLKVSHDQPVELRIAKRLSENWVRQPTAPAGPFAGSGNRLGSEAPAFNVAPPRSSAPVADDTARTGFSATPTFVVDPARPTTSLQIRLRDGTRMVARFNHDHTVGDLRSYINAANPGQSSVPYALQTTFPSRDLLDDKATLSDAGLLGSVVVQRGL